MSLHIDLWNNFFVILFFTHKWIPSHQRSDHKSLCLKTRKRWGERWALVGGTSYQIRPAYSRCKDHDAEQYWHLYQARWHLHLISSNLSYFWSIVNVIAVKPVLKTISNKQLHSMCIWRSLLWANPISPLRSCWEQVSLCLKVKPENIPVFSYFFSLSVWCWIFVWLRRFGIFALCSLHLRISWEQFA